ncbi:MAG: hypothetical protein ACRCZB_02930 [Bacteroidales bacterium]
MKTTLTLTFIAASIFLVMLISEQDGSISILNFLGAAGFYGLYKIKAVREAINSLTKKLEENEN